MTTIKSTSLANRLSLIVVMLLLGLAASMFFALFSRWRLYDLEQSQLHHWSLAENLARSIEPAATPELDAERFLAEVNKLEQLLQTIDVYLLTEEGEVVIQLCSADCTKPHGRVSMEPIHRFVSSTERTAIPMFGPDPGNPGTTSTFSAAEITARGKPHYLYIILQNKLSRRLFTMLQESTALRASIALAVGLPLIFALLGTWLIRRTTSRFSSLMDAIRGFESGELSLRAPELGTDELTELSRAFNGMAAAITMNIRSLEDRDERRRELIANIWHDIRTPVSGVTLLAETLEHASALSESDRRRISRSAFANVSLLNSLLSELGELGRLETGEILPAFEDCDPEPFLRDLEQAFRPRAEKAEVILQFALEPNLPKMRIDPGMISRVMSNLIENAVRHTPPQGNVAVAVRKDPHGLEFTVRDTGSGIAQHDLKRIFDRHYQGVSERGFSGLGLAIVKKMLEFHSSSIEVSSTSGQGSVFRFVLPLASDALRS